MIARRLLQYVFPLFLPFFAISQNIDELINQEVKETEIAKKVSLNIDIAWEYMLIEKDSSLVYSKKALDLSKENDYPFGQVISLEMIGIYQEAVQNKFDSAIKNYLQAVQIAQDNKIDYLPSLHLSIGILFERTDNYPKAEEYYSYAVTEGKKANKNAVVKIALINLAGVCDALGKYNEGIEFINESFQYPYVTDENDAAHHILGSLLMNKKEYQNAQKHLIKSVQTKDARTDLRYKFHYSKLLENKLILNDLNGLDSLIPIVENFYHTTEATNEKPPLARALSSAYTTLKNYDKAIFYKDQIITLEDSINKIKRDDLIYDLEIKYQTNLTKQELEKKRIEQKVYVFIAIVGVFLFLLISYFYYKNRKKNMLLALQKEKLEVTIDEKNTLLKETHHRVKNSFQIVSSLLYLQSENIEDQKAQVAIKEAQNRVRSMVLIHQKLYNKDKLVGINTQEYFEDLTNDILESHQANNDTINYKLNVESIILGIETITPIGLILNELLTNVIKHAFKSSARNKELLVTLQESNKELILQVTDNGVGMTDNPSELSFGIKLIKALSKKLKAHLKFEANEPQGTKATLRITRYEKL